MIIVNEIEAIECGKVVSRLNKALFDYQIGKRILKNLISMKYFILFS
jgi:hypothetical protein